MKRLSRLSRSALSTTALMVLLAGCGGGSSTVTSVPITTQTTGVQSSLDGEFALASAVSAPAAALVQLNVEPQGGEAPASAQVGAVSFVRSSVQIAPGVVTYIAPLEFASTKLENVSSVTLAGLTQAKIGVKQLQSADEVSLIYQNNPNSVTFEDYILVRATGDLPPDLRTAENIATRANELFPDGGFTAGSLNPVPDEINTNFVAGGSVPPPDLDDALAVLAALQLPPELRTPENIAAVINDLAPDADVAAADILAIPGESLPGGIVVSPPVSAVAGEIQISVQIVAFATPSFVINSANFVQQPGTPFPGFTTYLADAASSFLEVNFSQIDIPNLPATACVIVHAPGSDPNLPANQIATSAGCDSAPPPSPMPGVVLEETFDNADAFELNNPFFSDGAFDYLGLSDGMGGGDFGGDPIPNVPDYGGSLTGSFLAGSDLDGEGATLPFTLLWEGLNIAGLSDLSFSGDFAEDPFGGGGGSGPDQADFILVEAQIDGGGFQRVIEFRGDQEFNGSFREDTNGDGIGDGPIPLGIEAQPFVKSIAGSGSTLDLRLTLQLDSGFEDIAIDNFIIDTGIMPPPSPSPMPGITIPQIQGASQTSPFVPVDLAALPPDTLSISGDEVTTSGVVTAVDSNGFYLQDPVGDGDIATSDALFVFTGGAPSVSVGDLIQITATVSEFFPGDTDTRNLPTTQLSSVSNITPMGTSPLPEPVLIGAGGRIPPSEVINTGSDLTNFDPVNDGIDFFESLEGMRVTAQNTVAVAGTNQFGEIFTVVDNGAGATGISNRGTLNISPNDFNPEKVQVNEDSGLFNFDFPQVSVGAVLGNVTGVIGYSFGNFEILPTEDFTGGIVPSGLGPETSGLVGSPDQLTVASYNVLNLDPKVEDVNLVDDNDPDEIDDDLGAGRFDAIAGHIVNNLNAPDIIGLQEVQDNDGAEITEVTAADVTLQTLINAITAAGGPTYAFIDNPEVLPIPDAVNTGRPTGGQPGGNIRTAFLYRPDRVTPTEVNALAEAEETDIPGGTFFEARIPLAVEFDFNGTPVTVVNNHFSSKSGSAPILGVEQPFDALQEDPNVNGSLDERQAQSAVVQDFVSGILTADSQAKVAVLGDLNEFEFISPVTGLEAVGLSNLINTLPENERYSFIFQGNSQQLDHILVSNSFLGANVDIVHVNTEFPATSSRASDHDPVLSLLTVPPSDVETLAVGDIQIIGLRSTPVAGFAFVNWVPLAVGTQINFTTDSVGPAGNFIGLEPQIRTFTATEDLPAGTVTFVSAVTSEASSGTIEGSPLVLNTGGNGNQIFAFQGAKTTENLIFGFNYGNGGWLSSPTIPVPSTSFLPVELDQMTGNIDAGAVSTLANGQYIGPRSGEVTVPDYQDLIYQSNLPVDGNWEFSDGFLLLSDEDFLFTAP